MLFSGYLALYPRWAIAWGLFPADVWIAEVTLKSQRCLHFNTDIDMDVDRNVTKTHSSVTPSSRVVKARSLGM